MDQEKQKAPDSRVGSTMSPEEYEMCIRDRYEEEDHRE